MTGSVLESFSEAVRLSQVVALFVDPDGEEPNGAALGRVLNAAEERHREKARYVVVDSHRVPVTHLKVKKRN